MAAPLKHPAGFFAAVVFVALAAVLSAAAWFRADIEKNRAAYQLRQTESLLAGIAYDEITAGAPPALSPPAARLLGVSVVRRGGRAVAVVVRAAAGGGYGGDIVFLLRIRRDAGEAEPRLRVLRHKETPGIADFLNTSPRDAYDGVSGATISARALRDAALEVAAWWRDCFDWTAAQTACPPRKKGVR